MSDVQKREDQSTLRRFNTVSPETGLMQRKRAEITVADQRRIENLVIRRAGNLDRAERTQMIGDELRIEQAVMARP